MTGMPPIYGPPRRRRIANIALANARYLVALLYRFRVTIAASAVLFGVLPLVYVVLYVGPQGERIDYGEAFHHVYFLLFGQPSLPYVDDVVVETLNLLIPPLGVAVVVDGVVRFVLLAMARQRNDKEWIAVVTKMYENHVVVCGAGRIGYRIATQIRAVGRDVVVIEKQEDGVFVQPLRDMEIPVLIDDIRSRGCLDRVNLAHASALVAATSDDLANINVVLDARRVRPDIRVVIRLFDDDLASTLRETLSAEAMSTTAVAAPVMALAAIDPRIQHSFRVGPHLMVVSQFVAGQGLIGTTIAKIRDEFGGLTLALRGLDGHERLHPPGAVQVAKAEVLTIQAELTDYLRLRKHTGEEQVPISAKAV